MPLSAHSSVLLQACFLNDCKIRSIRQLLGLAHNKLGDPVAFKIVMGLLRNAAGTLLAIRCTPAQIYYFVTRIKLATNLTKKIPCQFSRLESNGLQDETTDQIEVLLKKNRDALAAETVAAAAAATAAALAASAAAAAALAAAEAAAAVSSATASTAAFEQSPIASPPGSTMSNVLLGAGKPTNRPRAIQVYRRPCAFLARLFT